MEGMGWDDLQAKMSPYTSRLVILVDLILLTVVVPYVHDAAFVRMFYREVLNAREEIRAYRRGEPRAPYW